MNRLQKIILFVFSPEKRAQIQAESQRWLLNCPRCGWKISVWEAGGIRCKAASIQKKVRGRCGGCGQREWFGVDKLSIEHP